jgi:hypothetical protein
MNDELRHELQSLTTDALENIVGTHFMFKDDCTPEIRSFIRRKHAAAAEILESRKTAANEISTETQR